MAMSAAIASQAAGQLAFAGRQHATSSSGFSSSLKTSTFTPARFGCPSQKYAPKRSQVVRAVAEQAEDVSELKVQRRSIMAAAAALTAALVGETFVTGDAKADIQKVEGAARDEQDAVTQGRREPSTIGRAAGNSIQSDARGNAQASGGLILGAPRLEKPGGAYRSTQNDTLTVGVDVDSKRSTPAGILQGNSPGKSSGQKSNPVE